jgi:hypothetical protein
MSKIDLAFAALLLISVLVGLAAGAIGAWLLMKGPDLGPRIDAIETRVRDVEAAWPDRAGALEAKVEKLTGETLSVGRRVRELAQRIAESRRTTSAAGATVRPSAEPTARPASAELRLTGIIYNGGQRAALFEDARDDGYVANVGGALPAGRVVEITDDTVTIERDAGKKMEIRLAR